MRFSGGAVRPAMKANDGLSHVRFDKGRGLLLIGAANFANHDDRLSLRVFLEHAQHVYEAGPNHRIAADADDSGLSQHSRR